MIRLSTKERARGQWRSILPALGIDADYLSGRNCPRPICGGKDRFRFIDRLDRDGMWVCNQCTPYPRPAIDLVLKFTGKPFKEAARMVDVILADGVVPPPRLSLQRDDGAGSRSYAARVWCRGVPVRRGDPVDQYLRLRRVGMDVYPKCLCTSELAWYRDESGAVSRYPAMLARVCDAQGNPVAVHRTFLAPDGSSKAPVPAPRKAAVWAAPRTSD